jgi:DNA-binding NtrC family response regulator
MITVDDLPDEIRPVPPMRRPISAAESGGAQTRTRRGPKAAEVPKTGEHLMIEDALRRYAGDKAKAARFIGWNRQKLYRRMRSFGISSEYGRKAA